MKLIYQPWGDDPSINTKGFPPEYPRYSQRIADGDPVPSGWKEISETDYKALFVSGYALVEAINAKSEEDSRDAERTELDALRRLFDEGDAIVDSFDSATNQQKFRLCLINYKIMRRNKRAILDASRPDAE